MADENNNPVNPFAEFEVPASNDAANVPVDNPFAKVNNQADPVVENPFVKPNAEQKEAIAVEKVVQGNVEAKIIENDARADLPPELQEDFSDELWGVLGQAGITKGTLFAFVFVFILIVGVLGYFFFWSGGGDEPEIVPEPNVSEEGIESVIESPAKSVVLTKSDESAPGVVSAYVFGREFKPIDPVPITYWGNASGIESAMIFGLDHSFNEGLLVSDLQLVTKMENAFNTDVYLLLNQSTDRRGALDGHIAEVEELVARGQGAVLQINSDLAILDEQFVFLNNQKNEVEDLYFASLDSNEGALAFDYYQQFLDLSYRIVDVKAEFQAKSYVLSRYENVNSFLEPRLLDINSNYEALIKGVRVFDVGNSDINAIIPV